MPKVMPISAAAPAGDGAGQPLPVIKAFLETSFLDWPSKIAAVLVLPGCNFRCPFCHNFELVSDPDQYESLPFQGIMDRLELFTGWIDGVVVSGGEPTLHPGLAKMLSAIKEAGFLVKLDTNGYRPWVIEELVAAGLVDSVSMDIKAPLDPASYRQATGRLVELDRIHRSIEFLKSSGIDHEFRSTIVPAWHDQAAIKAMAAPLVGAARWTLQAMDPATGWNREVMDGLTPFKPEELNRLQKSFADPVSRAAAVSR